LEGSPEHQIDVTTREARGNTTGNFQEGPTPRRWPGAEPTGRPTPLVGRPVGASTASLVPPPPLSFGGKLPGDFLMTVPSATCQALGVKVLVSPLYKYERGGS